MAQGAARSIDRSGEIADADRPAVLQLVARSSEKQPAALPVAARPVALEPVLSPSAEVLGLGRSAWLSAGVLYSSAVALLLLVELPVTPPEPWPEDRAVFQVVFEPPAAPAEPVEAPPTSAEQPQVVIAAPETASVLPEPPAAIKPPEPAMAQPLAQPLPPAPPRKPTPPSVASKPAAPSTAAQSGPAASAAQLPAGEQVAVLPPPAIEQPLVPPRPVGAAAGNAKPDYPVEARRRGQQGRVVLRVEVSAAGAPLSVVVATSSGHEVLDQAALRAVSGWRFTPATRGGAAVAGAVEVPVQFRLED